MLSNKNVFECFLEVSLPLELDHANNPVKKSTVMDEPCRKPVEQMIL